MLICVLYLLIIPFCMGLFFYEREEGKLMVGVKGYLIQWAVFFSVAIPCIVLGKTLTDILNIFVPVSFLLAIAGCVFFILAYSQAMKKRGEGVFAGTGMVLSKTEFVYLALFLGLWLFQMYKTIFYSFTDDDDAYYVVMANTINASDKLYTLDPYTGGGTTINYRYALAPFPAWIAGLSRLSGIPVSTLAHIVLSCTLITITYVIYNELAKRLFKGNREKQYMFMVLFSVFSIFSNVSQSIAETFMLTRSRQGKEALANIIIPFLFYYFLKLAQNEELRIGIKDTCFMIVLSMAGSLTSLFSNLLYCIAIGLFLIYSIYRKAGIKSIITLLPTLIPPVLAMLLYWRLG